jgi:hypothetical protein
MTLLRTDWYKTVSTNFLLILKKSHTIRNSYSTKTERCDLVQSVPITTQVGSSAQSRFT